MGIGRQQARALIAALKAGTPGRMSLRAEIGDAVDILHQWLNNHDAQMNTAAVDFAATKAGQFKTFTDALPDPAVDQAP